MRSSICMIDKQICREWQTSRTPASSYMHMQRGGMHAPRANGLWCRELLRPVDDAMGVGLETAYASICIVLARASN